MKNFWGNLPKPFLAQAPMENVTDVTFREMLCYVGAPDVFFTEFTSTDGITSQGREKVIRRFEYTQKQRPIVAQIWGNNPHHYKESVLFIKELGFDGVDINMGCPDRHIVARGCCSGLINNSQLAKEIILATFEAAGKNFPVSIKTRIGYRTVEVERWIGFLLELHPAAITVHLRTVKEMSKVPAHWEYAKEIVQLKNRISPKTQIIGNGDIRSGEDALSAHSKYGVDGVMIGRGMFKNLWIFNRKRKFEDITTEEKLETLIRHLELFDKRWHGIKPYDLMKKFFKVYTSGMPNASDIRTKLMESQTAKDSIISIRQLLSQTP
ncbi:MAG: tRNA-dihydrouridine synthase [Candidatus Levybacteria bacterium]|nr:tRNA-dihydrouridine synthase [Candidatus Levybacteria bacterium]